ncbi:M20 metallopeptidase family protein [Alkalibacter saccharofermentans]|uniref:Hippurate hydrolase n=1 Tax=Alkalibacter saccharofermentans DSM 14828 TaxID=1120975 RepID=A0A1M4XNW9_9FIRM|nr:amidohydrolase [Alkalibacter saccharofermentans]SHE95199.1 hippurate hydrolase [Alkalibacter saccharofermentans DSM 14828]
MKVRENILNMLDEAIKIRRDLHMIPEEGYGEYKTNAYIKKYLKDLGYEPEDITDTGVYLLIEGNDKETTTALRADMDGLSVREETDVDYTSVHESMMHACGHDGHMTILLVFAKYLKDNDIKPEKNILLIFQPAEEGPGGAKAIVEEGLLLRYNVGEIFGCHIMPDVDQGIVAVKSGPMMAQTGEFYIDIKGKSSHAAVPHQGIDAVVIASSIVGSLQTVVSRNINPVKTSLLSIGTISGGERVNVVARHVSLSGTMRSYEEAVYDQMKMRVIEILKGYEIAFNCTIEYKFIDMYPPVTNDAAVHKSFIALLDKDEYKEADPMMIAEDFSYYQKAVPGVFFYLGSRNEELGYDYGLHDCRFNFDESILLNAVEVYARLAGRERS